MVSRPPSTQGRFNAGLPLALRESTLQRLRVAAQICAGALILSEILTMFEVGRGAQPFYLGVHLARLLALALCLRGARLLQRADLPPATRLWQARAGIFGLACCIAFQECYYWPSRADSVLPAGLSRVSLIASLTPVLIPDSLTRSLTFSTMVLCTIPLAHWFSLVFGHPALPAFDLLLVLMRHFVSVGAAWMAAATVNQLREALSSEYGSYKLLRKLGQGGFGEVWEAVHRHAKRVAAIKLIRHDCDQDAEARFLREAETLSQLECPHTVRLYDYGTSESGQLYLVMELLKGVDLEELVKTYGPQPAERVASILAQACLSLEEAHGRELIHRDIKPANLFLCKVGVEPDFLKLIDFGLVKPNALGTNLTVSNALVGTPDFMSPEQIQGGLLDGRSDLYSLGAVGYFLLTGSPVFSAANPMGVLLGHLSQTPQAPSARLGAPLPDDLERVILRCLEKDPQQRFADARALFQELQNMPTWNRTQATAWWAERGR